MTPLSFLVLTDHRGHSDQNSVYSLVSTLVAHPGSKYVDVASRGLAGNTFAAGTQVRGFRADGHFSFQPTGHQFLTGTRPLDPGAYDVIWLRLPHPVDTAALTYLSGRALVVNDPAGIEETGDKAFLLQFPEWTPPVRLVHTAAEVSDFARAHPLVLKPLRAYGGHGIVRVDGANRLPALDLSEPYLAMKFLKNVSQGDKRILLVNGKIMAASLRLPAPGSWLCNVAQGGTSVGADIAPEERNMVEALAPELLSRGICFAGIDTLTDDDGRRVLSEINALSIGGFPQAQAQTGRPILQHTIDELLSYCHAHL